MHLLSTFSTTGKQTGTLRISENITFTNDDVMNYVIGAHRKKLPRAPLPFNPALHLRPQSFETTFIWDHIHLRPHAFETTFVWNHMRLRPHSSETDHIHLRPQSYETTIVLDHIHFTPCHIELFWFTVNHIFMIYLPHLCGTWRYLLKQSRL